MKALISPNETIYSYDGTVLGSRIVQICSDTDVFEVAQPLFWTDCPEGCISYNYYYLDGQFHVIPPRPEENLGLAALAGLGQQNI